MTKSPERKPLLAEQVTVTPMKIGCNVKIRRNLLDARSKLYRNLKQMKATLDFLKLPPQAILTNGDVA